MNCECVCVDSKLINNEVEGILKLGSVEPLSVNAENTFNFLYFGGGDWQLIFSKLVLVLNIRLHYHCSQILPPLSCLVTCLRSIGTIQLQNSYLVKMKNYYSNIKERERYFTILHILNICTVLYTAISPKCCES